MKSISFGLTGTSFLENLSTHQPKTASLTFNPGRAANSASEKVVPGRLCLCSGVTQQCECPPGGHKYRVISFLLILTEEITRCQRTDPQARNELARAFDHAEDELQKSTGSDFRANTFFPAQPDRTRVHRRRQQMLILSYFSLRRPVRLSRLKTLWLWVTIRHGPSLATPDPFRGHNYQETRASSLPSFPRHRAVRREGLLPQAGGFGRRPHTGDGTGYLRVEPPPLRHGRPDPRPGRRPYAALRGAQRSVSQPSPVVVPV